MQGQTGGGGGGKEDGVGVVGGDGEGYKETGAALHLKKTFLSP